MNQKITSVVKKSVKVGAAVCVAASAIALMTSGVALKAIGEGGKYLADAVKRIIGEQEAPQEDLAAASEEDFIAAEEN